MVRESAGPVGAVTCGASRMSWREAWHAASLGDSGFWRTQSPGEHFRTGTGPLLAEAMFALLQDVARDVPDAPRLDVLDVGAGDGTLLGHLHDLLRDQPLQDRVSLTGCDVRARPERLPGEVGWIEGTAPECLGDVGEVVGLVMAHEWLDEIPCAVVEVDAAGIVREVDVDPRTGEENLAEPADAELLAWLEDYWPVRCPGERAEVGLARDTAWAAVCGVLSRGAALAVDYGHVAEDRREARLREGTLAAYRGGRVVPAVPDGRCGLTAHVAMDSCAAAGSATLAGRGASVVTRLTPQRSRLAELTALDPAIPQASTAERLRRSSERRMLRDPLGMGSFLWLEHDIR